MQNLAAALKLLLAYRANGGLHLFVVKHLRYRYVAVVTRIGITDDLFQKIVTPADVVVSDALINVKLRRDECRKIRIVKSFT